MPKTTFLNLKDDKRENVVRAIFNEYYRVPLEEVSIKNIVNEAKIPRGSFYQYFEDKEDCLRYIIDQHSHESDFLFSGKRDELSFYDIAFIIFKRESEAIRSKEETPRIKLLKMISQSHRAMIIFHEEIQKHMMNTSLFEFVADNSGFSSLSDPEREVMMELIFTALKECMLTLIQDQEQHERLGNKLKLKLEVIKHGQEILNKETN